MKLISRPSYYRKLKQGGKGFDNLFAGYNIVQPTPMPRRKQLVEEEDDDKYSFLNPITISSSKVRDYEIPELSPDEDDYYYYYEENEFPETEEEIPEVIESLAILNG